jgi:cellulose biosynthesis protein BcsQ
MRTIVLASQKGGSGKTTIAAHLAVALERAGQGPAVLIDTDPQGSLARWWNKRDAPSPAFADATVRQLSEHGQVAPAVVADRVLFASSMIDGRTVFDVDPKGRSAEEIAALWKFVNSIFTENRKDVKRKEKALVETRHLD